MGQVKTDPSSEFEDMGLGLYICRRIIELMNGTMGVESKLGEGSRFWIEVPLKRPPYQVETEQENQKNMDEAICGANGGLSILVAEDNVINRKVIRLQLKKIGLEADFANDGQLAVDALEEKTYDLILMDCQMPVLDGFQATKTIRKRQLHKRTKILALTANAMPDIKQKCMDCGMDGFLTKPVRGDELLTAINQVMGEDIQLKPVIS